MTPDDVAAVGAGPAGLAFATTAAKHASAHHGAPPFPTGPAGLAFATTAAKRGHRVTLYEASDKIGGQFNLAKMVPGKVCGVPLIATTDCMLIASLIRCVECLWW